MLGNNNSGDLDGEDDITDNDTQMVGDSSMGVTHNSITVNSIVNELLKNKFILRKRLSFLNAIYGINYFVCDVKFLNPVICVLGLNGTHEMSNYLPAC